MSNFDYVIDFILKYLVCPWSESSSFVIAAMLITICSLLLVFIIISLNNTNNCQEECKKLRQFIYTSCALLIPAFVILLPIYLYIPSLVFCLVEINKKEKIEIERIYGEYSISEHWDSFYKNQRCNIKYEVIIIVISSFIIVSAMQIIGFGYHFKPFLPVNY